MKCHAVRTVNRILNVSTRAIRERHIQDKILIGFRILDVNTECVHKRQESLTGARKVKTCVLIVQLRRIGVVRRHTGVVHLNARELQLAVIHLIRCPSAQALADCVDLIESRIQIRCACRREEVLAEFCVIKDRPGIHIVIEVQHRNALGTVSQHQSRRITVRLSRRSVILADTVNRGVLRRVVVHHFTLIVAVTAEERIGVGDILRKIRRTVCTDRRVVILVTRINLPGKEAVIPKSSGRDIALQVVDVLKRNNDALEIIGSELICQCIQIIDLALKGTVVIGVREDRDPCIRIARNAVL